MSNTPRAAGGSFGPYLSGVKQGGSPITYPVHLSPTYSYPKGAGDDMCLCMNLP